MKRKNFTQAEKIKFAEKHDRTCAICGKTHLISGNEAIDRMLDEGVYSYVPDEILQMQGYDFNKRSTRRPYFKATGKERCAREREFKKQIFHIDHIIPLTRGGTNDSDNLQLLCAFCNVSKSNMTNEEYLAKISERTEAGANE